MSRVIFIGDVHGCLDELDGLLRTLEHRRDDQLVFLGDLMDRGPDPVGVVRRVRELGAQSVCGNHDEKHLRWRRHERRRAENPSYRNPMRTLSPEAAAQNAALSDEEIAWMMALPIVIQVPHGASTWMAVHAGFEPSKPFEAQRPEKMLRVRYVDEDGDMVAIKNDVDQPGGTMRWAPRWQGRHHVVYGHHAVSLSEPTFDFYVPEPSFAEHCEGHESGRTWQRIGIDTGCCFGGRLTALVLEGSSQNIVSVPSRGKYAKYWGEDSA